MIIRKIVFTRTAPDVREDNYQWCEITYNDNNNSDHHLITTNNSDTLISLIESIIKEHNSVVC